MDCKISTSEKIEGKYIDWAKSVISPFSETIVLNGTPFKIKPVDEIHILNQHDYDLIHKASAKESLNFESGFEPSVSSYSCEVSSDLGKVSGFYNKLNKVSDSDGPSFWKPSILGNGSSSAWESHIYLCPERMKKRAENICSGLHEIHNGRVEKLYFRVALLHEIGHHITFCNFNKNELLNAVDLNDKNLFESLANVIAATACTKEERWVLAESAVDQRLCYRYYTFFRYSSKMTEIFHDLLDNHDPKSALMKFWDSIGAQIDLNGYTLIVESLNGLISDWYQNGGKIISPGHLEFIGTIYDGCVIASQIDHLIGRFPSNTLVLANRIVDLQDYGRYPDNIRIVSKSIRSIIEKHKDKDDTEKLKAILEDLGIEEAWKRRLLRPAKHGVKTPGI